MRPPADLKELHVRFADSMERVIQAHRDFNEASFGRSNKPVSTARDDLRLALEDHKKLQQEYEQQLDRYLQASFDVTLDRMPEIRVSIEP